MPGDPRAAHVRLDQEPGLRLPPEDDPDRDRWKARWEQFLRNRAVLEADGEENTGTSRTVNRAIEWLGRRGTSSEPFLLPGSTCSARTDRGTRPSRFREQYAITNQNPTSSRPATKESWSTTTPRRLTTRLTSRTLRP